MPELHEHPGDHDHLQRTARTVARALAVAAALVVVAIGSSVIAAATGPDRVTATTKPAMLAVAPGGVIDRKDVPQAIVGHYEMAERHAEVFAEIPCFCGCEEMLDHRHLLDCFVRPDGGGWEAHAAGCGVCLGEAQQVEDLLATGITDPAAIEDAVVAQWGDPYQSNQEE